MGGLDLCASIVEELRQSVRRCSRGRSRGVYEAEILLGGCEILLTVFTGREGYTPWAEVGVIGQCHGAYNAIEELVGLLSRLYGGIPRVMITYTWDPETSSLLSRGAHPAATRIGSILVSKGYYLVRDMYYPEGFTEGSPKIVGERYVDNKWYLEALCEEVSSLRSSINRGPGGEGPGYAESSLKVITRVIEGAGYRC